MPSEVCVLRRNEVSVSAIGAFGRQLKHAWPKCREDPLRPSRRFSCLVAVPRLVHAVQVVGIAENGFTYRCPRSFTSWRWLTPTPSKKRSG